MSVTRVVVKKTPITAELWYYGTEYRSGRHIAERVPFADLRRGKTPQIVLEALETEARGFAKHWNLAVEREGW